MSKVTNGADLVRRLKASGTGEGKLAVARECLESVYRDSRRVASSDEVIAALESRGVYPDTVKKARRIVETGLAEEAEVAPVEQSIEDRLAPVLEIEPAKSPDPVVTEKSEPVAEPVPKPEPVKSHHHEPAKPKGHHGPHAR